MIYQLIGRMVVQALKLRYGREIRIAAQIPRSSRPATRSWNSSFSNTTPEPGAPGSSGSCTVWIESTASRKGGADRAAREAVCDDIAARVDADAFRPDLILDRSPALAQGRHRPGGCQTIRQT